MAAKGYVSDIGALVGAWYGSALDDDQAARAALWLETAEQVIDGATGTSFLTGAIAGERHTPDGPYVYLRRVPLASATVTITGYHRGSTTGTLLTLTDQYEVDDLVRGRVFVPAWRSYRSGYLLISYTPVTTIPTAIQDATAALLADWVATGGPGGAAGSIVREKAGDVEVQYAAPSTVPPAQGLPPRVLQLLAPYLRPLAFA